MKCKNTQLNTWSSYSEKLEQREEFARLRYFLSNFKITGKKWETNDSCTWYIPPIILHCLEIKVLVDNLITAFLCRSYLLHVDIPHENVLSSYRKIMRQSGHVHMTTAKSLVTAEVSNTSWFHNCDHYLWASPSLVTLRLFEITDCACLFPKGTIQEQTSSK